jgi:hypothetical protein
MFAISHLTNCLTELLLKIEIDSRVLFDAYLNDPLNDVFYWLICVSIGYDLIVFWDEVIDQLHQVLPIDPWLL